MAKAGRKRSIGVMRTPSGRASRAAVNSKTGAESVPYAVYFVASIDRVKIGYTGNLASRIASIESNSGRAAEVLGIIRASSQSQALEIEDALHQSLIAEGRHFQGEWFSIGRADVYRFLAAARAKGLQTMGGEDSSADVRILSSLAYTAENVLSLEDISRRCP